MGQRSLREELLGPGPTRTLALLAAIALLMVVLAVFAVMAQRAGFTSDFEPRPAFPELADRVNEAAKIVVESRQQKVTVVRDALGEGPQGGAGAVWRVLEKAGHPAKPDMVKRTVVGLAQLELFEPRTAQREWHQHLGLRAPEDKGAGVRVAVFDAKGDVLASLIAGKLEGSRDIDGRGTIYVRRDGEDQTYVARGWFNLEQNPVNWLSTQVIDLAPGRVREVQVRPAEGPAYTVVLAQAPAANGAESDAAGVDAAGDAAGGPPAYVIRDLDPALRPKTYYAITGIGNALVGLTFMDVMPADEVRFEAPVESRFVTGDGLVIIARAEKLGDRYVAVFDAEALPDASDEVRAEAARRSAMLRPFAYQLTTFDGADLTRTLAALTEPADAPATPEGEGAE